MTDAEIAAALRTAQNALTLVRELATTMRDLNPAEMHWVPAYCTEIQRILPDLAPFYEALEARTADQSAKAQFIRAFATWFDRGAKSIERNEWYKHSHRFKVGDDGTVTSIDNRLVTTFEPRDLGDASWDARSRIE